MCSSATLERFSVGAPDSVRRRGLLFAALLAAAPIALACAHTTEREAQAVGPLKVRVGAIAPEAFDYAANAPTEMVDRTERLVDLFFQAGCTGSRLTQPRHGRYPDVVCRLPGRSAGAIVVAAYIEPSKRDGEDWSGAALLPQLYRALSVQAREHSFVFVGLGDTTRRNLELDVQSTLEEAHSDRLRALVDVQRLRVGSADLLFSSADPELRQDLGAVGAALGLPKTALRFVDVPDAHHRDLPMIVLASPRHVDAPPEQPADGREAYHSAARVIAVYLAYLDDTLRLRQQQAPPTSTPAPVSADAPEQVDPL